MSPNATLAVIALAACGSSDPAAIDASIDAPPAALAFSSDSLSVPLTYINDSVDGFVLITNIGKSTSGAIAIGHGDSTEWRNIITDCTSLLAGGVCSVGFTFAPTQPGPSMLAIQFSADPGGTAMTTATGTGRSNALAVAPATLDFGTLPNGSKSATPLVATVTNTGAVATSSLSVLPIITPFVPRTDTCSGQVLAAAATCTVSLDYAPTSTTTGGDHMFLTIRDDPGGIAKVAVRGHSTQP